MAEKTFEIRICAKEEIKPRLRVSEYEKVKLQYRDADGKVIVLEAPAVSDYVQPSIRRSSR